jgi:hypothetical protein
MAIMYPKNIEGYKYTNSEKFFYNNLKKELPDSCHIFFSVIWISDKNGIRKNSECDFLIFNPEFGYLTVEVKGGHTIEVVNGEWRLHLKNGRHGSDQDYRVLRKSPMKQATNSMYYFKNQFKEENNYEYKGVFGAAVAFPFYNIDSRMSAELAPTTTIDSRDIGNLKAKINQIFHYWKGQSEKFIYFSEDDKNKFIKFINKRIAMSAAAGALIELKEQELEKVNRVQENYIHCLHNYHRAFIAGGAGTGKTWIAVKKATEEAKNGKRVKIFCCNEKLKLMLENLVEREGIYVETFQCYAKRILSNSDYNDFINNERSINDFSIDKNLEKYDAVFVDEGQDFKEDWALHINKLLLSESSILWVMNDQNQNIFDRNYMDGFLIDYPPFLLKENLRNTSSILEWAKMKTGMGLSTKPSIIEGVEPEIFRYSKRQQVKRQLNKLLNNLVDKEKVNNHSITILCNVPIKNSVLNEETEIGRFKIVETIPGAIEDNQINFSTIQSFKGLESDVVILVNHLNSDNEKISDENLKVQYVAYTRARFYLYIIEFTNKGNSII